MYNIDKRFYIKFINLKILTGGKGKILESANSQFSFNGNAPRDSDLEFILGQLLDEAARAVENIPQEELERRKAEILRAPEIRYFSQEFAFYRYAGAMAMNHLNAVWASRAAGGDKTSRAYLRIDAHCNSHGSEGKRVATALLPIGKELAKHVPIGAERFIDTDNPEVADGVAAYLNHRRLGPGNMIYSHLDEQVNPDNTVYCCEGEDNVPFKPTSTLRIIADKAAPDERRAIEGSIISELAGQLRFAGKPSEDALREDLEAIFHVKDGKYDSLYDAFEQTRFFVATLSDIARLGRPAGCLNILTQFGDGQRLQNGRKQRHYGMAGWIENARNTVIGALEDIIYRHIKAPYEVFEYGVKSPDSLAGKVLLNRLHGRIVRYFNDGTLNAYLESSGFKPLTEGDVRQRDLRDLIRMAWVVHGDSKTYDISEGNLGHVPAEEEAALTKVWDGVHLFGIPQEYRGLDEHGMPRWRQLGWRTSQQNGHGVAVNWSDSKDVKDYITRPKGNGFRELKMYAYVLGASPTAFEIQMMTNYMNNLNRFSDDSDHAAFKARNCAIIAFCIQQGAISRSTADAIRFVVTNSLDVIRLNREAQAEPREVRAAPYAP